MKPSVPANLVGEHWSKIAGPDLQTSDICHFWANISEDIWIRSNLGKWDTLLIQIWYGTGSAELRVLAAKMILWESAIYYTMNRVIVGVFEPMSEAW